MFINSSAQISPLVGEMFFKVIIITIANLSENCLVCTVEKCYIVAISGFAVVVSGFFRCRTRPDGQKPQ